MLYFAYGSNLSREQMLTRCPGTKPKFIATLHNYKLIFTGWSRRWKGGVASIKKHTGGKVAGALYEISESGLRLLDKHEEYPENYDHLKVTVITEDGDPVEAITYIKKVQVEETNPSQEYISVMQKGYKDWGII